MRVLGDEADAAHHLGDDFLLGRLGCVQLLGLGSHVLNQIDSDVIKDLEAGAVVVNLAELWLFVFAQD